MANRAGQIGLDGGPGPGAGGGGAELSLEMRSNPLYLSAAREMLSAVTKRLGFTDEASGQIALAVDEALCNIIRHGYNRDLNRPIWIKLFPEGDGWVAGGVGGGVGGAGADGAAHPASVRIVIEDEARQVDPATIKSRNLEEVRPGGLGVHIIRSVMDEVRYERREDGRGGMRLIMVKKRVGSAAPDAAAVGAGVGGAAHAPKRAGGGHG